MMLDSLPDRGWGVLRDVSFPSILLLAAADIIKVEVTPIPNVWQARLTSHGRYILRGL